MLYWKEVKQGSAPANCIECQLGLCLSRQVRWGPNGGFLMNIWQGRVVCWCRMVGDKDDGLCYMVHDIKRVKLDVCCDVAKIKQILNWASRVVRNSKNCFSAAMIFLSVPCVLPVLT